MSSNSVPSELFLQKNKAREKKDKNRKQHFRASNSCEMSISILSFLLGGRESLCLNSQRVYFSISDRKINIFSVKQQQFGLNFSIQIPFLKKSHNLRNCAVLLFFSFSALQTRIECVCVCVVDVDEVFSMAMLKRGEREILLPVYFLFVS